MDPMRFDRFARAVSARFSRRTALRRGGAGLIGSAAAALGAPILAQPASPVASPEAGGAARFLFVQSLAAGTLEADRDGWLLLTLTGAPAWTIAFADHPSRKTNALPTGSLPDELAFEAANPPNAALVVRTADGAEQVHVLELLDPTFDAEGLTLTYRVRETEDYDALGAGLVENVQPIGDVPAQFGGGNLFIDSASGGCDSFMQLCNSDDDCCTSYRCIQTSCAPEGAPNGLTFGASMCFPSQD